jgi:hypothetical protein
MGLRSEFVGKTFTRLLVEDVWELGQQRRLVCLCSCGARCVVLPALLRKGLRKSCGCLKRSVLGDSTRTHGQANSSATGYTSRTYGIWQAMRDRCSNPNRKDWHCYGGKGIAVCPAWQQSFEAFVRDMGEAPEGLTLERVDGSKGYAPDNCRWATRAEQSRNTLQTTWVSHAGGKHTISDWLRIKKIPKGTYYWRVRNGWSRERAMGFIN